MDVFRRIFSGRIFSLGLLSIAVYAVLGVVFYLASGWGAESSVGQQFLSREQVIARAEASNIILFFQKFGNSVAFLAQLSSIESGSASAGYDLDTFVNQQRDTGFVWGVVLTDKDGVVQLNSNVLGTRDTGVSLADRDFFVWAKTQGEKGEYFITHPVVSRLGASKGKTIIVVASPVYRNGTFKGVVAASVIVQPLVERFFGLMKVSDLTEIYLFDGRGDLLYGNSAPDMVGANISDLFPGDQTLREKVKSTLGLPKEGQFQSEKYFVAYSPILLGTQTWQLIISTPAKEVIDPAGPLYVRQIALMILAGFTILLLGVIVIRRNQV